MSPKVPGSKHPETTGGAAGRGPGRGEDKLTSTAPGYKKGTTPSKPGRPVTHLKPPRRPNDTKN